MRTVLKGLRAQQEEATALRAEVLTWKTHSFDAEALEGRARAELAEARTQLARVDVTSLTAQMHRHLGAPINDGTPSAAVPEPQVEVRIALAREEFREYRRAAREGDIVGVADGLADLIYVLYGTAHTYGIPIDDVLAEVHRSNMTKSRNPAGGKFLKGPGFSPANVAGVLEEHGVECVCRTYTSGPSDPEGGHRQNVDRETNPACALHGAHAGPATKGSDGS